MSEVQSLARFTAWPLRIRDNSLKFGFGHFFIEVTFYPEEVELAAKRAVYMPALDTAYLPADASAERIIRAVVYAAERYWERMDAK